jgi:hypothetical protein
MDTPLLLRASDGRNFLAFEGYDTPEWFVAVEWLASQGFSRGLDAPGTPVVALDQGIIPSFERGETILHAGWDNWSGNYLSASCDNGDRVLVELASHVGATDRRPVA